MKILVPVKRVADPDNANKVKVSSDGSQISTEGLEWKMNPFDEWALEAALRLTENGETKKREGEVVLVSIGPQDATQTIRQGLAMGADRAILVEAEDEQLDSASVAKILAAVAAKETPDIVLMGKQAADGDSNATSQALAEHLGWPMATSAMTLKTSDGGKLFTIKRELDTGVLTLEIDGPAVLSASDRILQPEAVRNGVTPETFAYPETEGGRYASLKGIMAAKKKPIDKTTPQELNVEMTTLVEYMGFTLPPARSGETAFIETVGELVSKLKSEAKVL
ncbi:MAG: electron transfer flavoprotein subunit beta/FixA family protein [Myxococcota bacterium]